MRACDGLATKAFSLDVIGGNRKERRRRPDCRGGRRSRLPPDLLSNAFEPFGRGGDDGGTGLGLAIVSAVAQTHSGRTSATNLSSGGSRVLLEFPDVGATGQEAGKAGTTNNP
jgi:hypothetical protein